MIKVKVCCGTSCYVMGSSELISMDLSSFENVQLEGTTCMNLCKDRQKRPPYVVVNDQLYCQVTPEKLLKILEDLTNDL